MTVNHPVLGSIPSLAATFSNMLTQLQALKLVRLERAHQDKKWGTIDEKQQSVPGYLIVAKSELSEAGEGWLEDREGRHSCLAELVQTAAVCIAAIEQYGDYKELFSLYPQEFFDHLREQDKGHMADLEREVDYLHDRLEDNRAYDFEGNVIQVKPGSIPDGIECRDETIKLMRDVIAEKDEEIARLQDLLHEKGVGEAQ